MLLLTQGTGHLIQIVTDAAGDIETNVSYVDKTGTGPSSYSYAGVGDAKPSITTATTTTTQAGAASTERSIRELTYYNNHASQAVTCTIQLTDGTDTVTLCKVVLAAGERLSMDAAGVWTHFDANMGPYVGVGPIATQAEMEGGTSTTVIVTPGRQHYHPSAAKFWVKTRPGAVNDASYNVTSVLDTAAGITVVTIATDFSSSNWCCQCSCESTSDTMTVTNLKTVRIGLGDQAAGTVSIEVHDFTAITAVLEDPTAWHVMGFGDL